MKKEPIWRNSSIQMAALAALAAAIAGYLILTSSAHSNGLLMAAADKAPMEKKDVNPRPDTENEQSTEQKMLMALRISDYEILKPRLKKGLRIDIVFGYSPNQNNGLTGKTILENVLVADVPPSTGSRLSSGEQGILIEISKEDCERLVGIASFEPLRVLINED